MKKLAVLNLVLAICLSVGLWGFAGTTAAQEVHWGYEGEHGPEHWGEINAVCAEGTEQSPIDIPADAPTHAADILFSYQPSNLNILNNGHTIQVNYDPGSYIMVGDTRYNLFQFHFHALSEHTVQGEHTGMEVHLVHQSDAGEYAVVGVLMDEGAQNAAFEPVLSNMPAEEGSETIEGVSVNAEEFLPGTQTYWHYNGSFTTPPCTEGVKWFLMNTPVEISAEQMDAYEAIYDNNYRPVQPFNDRVFFAGDMAHDAEMDHEEAMAPEMLPVTGGEGSTLPGVMVGFLGALAAGAGLYLWRRKAA